MFGYTASCNLGRVRLQWASLQHRREGLDIMGLSKGPVAYIRRSAADINNPGDVSREVQLAAVEALAKKDGQKAEVRIFEDWAKSADAAKESRRIAFLAMLDEIEAGRVSVVYAYATDRLYRSMRTFTRLTDLANRHGVRIVTQRDGILGGDGSPMAQAFSQVGAVFAELELNTAKARARSVARARKERGDFIGRAPFGWKLVDRRLTPDPSAEPIINAVAQAFREAGSFQGAARKMNEAGIASSEGGLWDSGRVGIVLRRSRPELVPPIVRRGSHALATATFAGLLRCHCGQILAATGGAGPRRQYSCRRANVTGAAHRRKSVWHGHLTPWITAEVAHLVRPDRLMQATDDGLRHKLEAKRARIIDAAMDGTITSAERDKRLAPVVSELEALAAGGLVAVLPDVDWTADAAQLNRVLSTILRSVQLNEDMRPVSAQWAAPEWRDALPSPPPSEVVWDDRQARARDLAATTDLTYYEIAERVGCHPGSVQNWLRGPVTRPHRAALRQRKGPDPRRAQARALAHSEQTYAEIAEKVGADVIAVGRWLGDLPVRIPPGITGRQASGRRKRKGARADDRPARVRALAAADPALTARAIAERVGCHPHSVHNWLREYNRPPRRLRQHRGKRE